MAFAGQSRDGERRKGLAKWTIRAVTTSELRAPCQGRALSLDDRCCLALTIRSHPPEVLTADLAWAVLDVPIKVRLLR